jgi:type I restriction enzyme S subunit
MHVCIPSREAQDRTAEVLGALDDKISVNRRNAETSRQLASIYFARGHRPARTASLATVTIANLIQRGDLMVGDGYRTKRSEHAETGFRIIRVTDVVEGTVAPTGPDRVGGKFAKAIGGKAGRPGDVLLTTKGTVGRVALTPDLDEQIVYSPQICYFRCSENSRVDRFYLRYWFESAEFRTQADHRMNNTDMAPYISLADIRSLQLTMPEAIKARALSDQLAALENTAQGLLRENAQLSELRDTLLPHLMSGRLRVKDAEKHVETVV